MTAAAQSESVVQAQNQVAQAQAQLRALNDQVEHAQAELDAANRQLEQDQVAQAALDRQLQEIARFQYTQPALPVQVIRAGSVSEALGDINRWRVVGSREQSLLNQQKELRARDQRARDQVADSLKTVRDAQDQARQVAAQAQASLNAAQAEEYRQLAAMANATAGQPGPISVSSHGGGNHFSYGYCTWYVASRRDVPWFGNAIEWWPNARAYGYAEGSAPAVGAIMVTAESGAGHVAYVEAVNPDGSWTVSEMNFAGWGVVSRRTLRYGQAPVVGFIYGHS